MRPVGLSWVRLSTDSNSESESTKAFRCAATASHARPQQCPGLPEMHGTPALWQIVCNPACCVQHDGICYTFAACAAEIPSESPAASSLFSRLLFRPRRAPLEGPEEWGLCAARRCLYMSDDSEGNNSIECSSARINCQQPVYEDLS